MWENAGLKPDLSFVTIYLIDYMGANDVHMIRYLIPCRYRKVIYPVFI